MPPPPRHMQASIAILLLFLAAAPSPPLASAQTFCDRLVSVVQATTTLVSIDVAGLQLWCTNNPIITQCQSISSCDACVATDGCVWNGDGQVFLTIDAYLSSFISATIRFPSQSAACWPGNAFRPVLTFQSIQARAALASGDLYISRLTGEPFPRWKTCAAVLAWAFVFVMFLFVFLVVCACCVRRKRRMQQLAYLRAPILAPVQAGQPTYVVRRF